MNPITNLVIRIPKQRGRDTRALDTRPKMVPTRDPATTADPLRIETRTSAQTAPVKLLHITEITFRMIITHATAVDKRIATGIKTMAKRSTIHRVTSNTRDGKTALYETTKMTKIDTVHSAIAAEIGIQIATTLMTETETEIGKDGMSAPDALVVVSGRPITERQVISRREALATETVLERKVQSRLIAMCPAPAAELRN